VNGYKKYLSEMIELSYMINKVGSMNEEV